MDSEHVFTLFQSLDSCHQVVILPCFPQGTSSLPVCTVEGDGFLIEFVSFHLLRVPVNYRLYRNSFPVFLRSWDHKLLRWVKSIPSLGGFFCFFTTKKSFFASVQILNNIKLFVEARVLMLTRRGHV